MKYLLLYLVIINLISIMVTVFDKLSAKHNGQRTRERTLLLLAIIGGAVGMYIVMRIIRHKTRKNKFMVLLPLIVLLQAALLVFMYFKLFGKI